MQRSNTFLVVLLALITLNAYAIPKKLKPSDLQCSIKQTYLDHSIYYLNKTAPKKSSTVYLIKNTAAYPILIDHPKKNPGAGAGWATLLAPNRWSVIAVSEKDFSLQCKIIAKGVVYEASCAFLKICQPKQAFRKKLSGNYWVAENREWNALAKKVVALH